ncbi:MAG: CDP-alcohol phosphatidyltransferase family protein [Oscillospiraceae bacterium]|jgi:CDP-diacylglycerol--serine O-phosphatidyltransferase
MIGFYDYTVILTYLSLLSASVGIVISLSGSGHPYLGSFFLLFCGLCDAFDGKVARTKENRTKTECNFGIQIDSLSDLVAFGVLPACIGVSLIQSSPFLHMAFPANKHIWYCLAGKFFLHAILVLYILAAMIRLAYFNVTEEERQQRETCSRTYYTGMPVTSAALIFPFVLLLQYLLPIDITLIYIGFAVLTGIAFLCRIQIRKPGLRGIFIIIAIGLAECIALMLYLRMKYPR